MKEIDITKDLYLCSPLLNTECSKDNCYINNGSCCHTIVKEHSQKYLQDKIKQYEDPEDLTLFYMWLDEKAKDKIKQMQEENKNLKQINEEHRKLNGELREENEKLREENKHIFANVNDDQLLRSNAMNYAEAQDYKTRNEKAVEYIKEDMYVEPKELYGLVDGEHLLNILQGSDE